MIPNIPFRSLLAIVWDALQSLVPPLLPARPGVPVFIMLPLDAAQPNACIPFATLKQHLRTLADLGVAGVMVDVWWRLCEPAPGAYHFDPYVDLFRACHDVGLKVQATMSFHSCGGNVGDTVDIPLPDWVLAAGDRHAFWFQDKDGLVIREYISFGADHKPVLPGVPPKPTPAAALPIEQSTPAPDSANKPSEAAQDAATPAETPTPSGTPAPAETPVPPGTPAVAENGTTAENDTAAVPPSPAPAPPEAHARSPLQAYAAFVAAFMEAVSSAGLTAVLSELQLGLGPCGELRYPSYPLADGRWAFPGIGQFQCFDKYLLEELSAAQRGASDEVRGASLPPRDTGGYNSSPGETPFFRHGFRTAAGKWFLDWHSDVLLRHGADVLRAVRVVAPDIAIAVKVSGVHWWRFHASRAAEATSGYVSSRGAVYGGIARMLKDVGGVLDFTCLEMRTVDQPFLRARCAPRQLVAEVFRTAAREGVPVAGENALERLDWAAYRQILSAFRRTRARAVGFTLLRLGERMMEEGNLETLQRFVQAMNRM